ncbi:MAG: PRC-barrel domain-containing protein [Actinobacteria bacterium]|nr:PRC-barrel domain-containing protein [Actinomycetota bacterium]
MKRLSELVGTRVMSRDSAERVGKLERVVFDNPPRRITAVQVGKSLVDWEAVSGLGTDAVVIDSGEALRSPSGRREDQAVAGAYDWKGKRVLSDGGTEIGTIVDVEVDETTGMIESMETTASRLGADRLVALGSYCLVVADDARAAPDAQA